MSPNENDLRAALRDGEGDDRPDVDRVLADARSRRGQRRTRVLGVATAVVLVAAAAVGTAVWRGSNDNGQQSAGPAGTVRSAADSSVAAIGAVCPSTYPTRAVPAVGAGGSGSMFSAPIATALVCSYDESGSTAARSGSHFTVSGADAATLATSIEQASTSRLMIMCPDIVAADKKLIAIVGVTAGGTILPTVTTDVSVPNCNEPITNGTAVRYAWKPPAALSAKINALR